MQPGDARSAETRWPGGASTMLTILDAMLMDKDIATCLTSIIR